MSKIKVYNLPHGKLYVNKDNETKVIFDKSGNPIYLKKNQSHFEGSIEGIGFDTYFLNPDFWDIKLQAKEVIDKKNKFDVLIKMDEIDRYGDHIMLTLYPLAIKYTYGNKANVDILIQKKYEEVWYYNQLIRNVYYKNPELDYDLNLDANGIELKFKPADGISRCSDQLLAQSQLYLANKTPIYIVSEDERKWATEYLENKPRPIIGIATTSASKVRAYPNMKKIIDRLRKENGYSVLHLDAVLPSGKFKYNFRQMGALVNECNIIVTSDSAILHLAGALRKRIVGVFGSTDGKITTEDYEKALVVQGKCNIASEPCWWEVPCIKGSTYQEKEKKANTPCLINLNTQFVIDSIDVHLTAPKKLFICMLTYNLLDMTKRAIDSIRSFHDYDIFVVDNESGDGTQEWLKEKGIDHIVKRTSVAGAQNLGLQKFLEGNYDYFVLLNNDIILRYDTLDKLVDCAEASRAYGVMSSEIPNTPHWAVDSVKAKDGKWEEIVNIPPGSYSCTLLTKECIEKIGFFNERFTPRYIEDNDYTLRMRLSGGKFVKSNNAIYWHYLGGVVKNNAEAKKTHGKNWEKNINIFQEIYGIHPHDNQDLEKLGLEWKRNVSVDSIAKYIKKNKYAIVNIIRAMGGWGDILFTSVLARELKKEFGKKIDIIYSIPHKFFCILENNPYVKEFCDLNKRVLSDFRIDLTDLEFRVELQEMQKYGGIRSARTEIYLNALGWVNNMNFTPDYFVTDEEADWAKEVWNKYPSSLKRVVLSSKGSNKLKIWPQMKELKDKLAGVALIDIETNSGYKYSFREVAALISQADLVISPDSGISNLAGSLNIPVVAIFSNRNKENFEKMFTSMIGIQGECPFQDDKNYCDFFVPCFGSGPHRSKENIDVPKCLKNLSLDKVMDRINEILMEKEKNNV